MIAEFNNVLFLIVGQSGSGKDTLVQKLCNHYGTSQIISYTTRKKRNNLDNGHIFIVKDVDDAGFKRLKSQFPNIITETIYDDEFYFTTRDQIETNQFYIIDVIGLKTLKNNYDGTKSLITVYLDSNSEIRKKRMLNRGDPLSKIEQRLKNDIILFKEAPILADYTINADMNETEVLKAAIKLIDSALKRKGM